jgi:hypothetical protein
MMLFRDTFIYELSQCRLMLTRGYLLKIRHKAIRRRVYHRALDRLERGILDLSTRLLDEARNLVLLEQLLEIVNKLEDAVMSRYQRHLESFGARRVTEIILQALKFGYKEAVGWLQGTGFVEYITVMDLNGASFV